MSAEASPSHRSIGTGRLLFPFIVIALAAAVLVVVQMWKNTEIDSSKRSMIKMVTALFTGVLLLLWALRMPGWKKRYVWLVFIGAVALTFVFVRYDGMKGNFLPTFVARDWVLDTFLGGSPDTLLERHRQAQGRVEGGADLTDKPGDWPAFRGPNRDGIVADAKLARDWKKNPPREVWRQPVGGGWAAFVVANGFLVTLEQRRDKEVVACYEAATGKEVWTTSWTSRFSEPLGGDGPRATPAIAGGDVFAFGANGRLVCLNGKDGRERWSVETLAGNENVQWAMSGSPLIVDSLVIVNPGVQIEAARAKGAVRAFDRLGGGQVWAGGNQRTGYCSPQLATIGGTKQVLIFDAFGLAGYDAAHGYELWRFSYPTYQGINVAQPIVLDDSNIVIAAGYNVGGARIKVTESGGKWTATEVWRTKNTVMRWKFASGVRRKEVDGDYAYGLNDGFLECVDLKNGRAIWKDENRPKEGEGIGHGQILLADDLIIAVTEDSGELVLVEASPKAFRELGRIKVVTRGNKTWNNLALAHGRIYIRNAEEMVCYDMTGQ